MALTAVRIMEQLVDLQCEHETLKAQLDVKFTVPSAGWINLLIRPLHDDVPIRCSEVWDPFEQFIEWLETIANGAQSATWYISCLSDEPDPQMSLDLGRPSSVLRCCQMPQSGYWHFGSRHTATRSLARLPNGPVANRLTIIQYLAGLCYFCC